MKPRILTAEAFEPLLTPSRYKGAWGGRGSGKSHFFAELLVEDHIRNPGMHSVCIREVQKSLAQSAKRTIERKIEAMGVGHLFDVQKAEIKAPGGGLIIFQGMQNHTADSIKSLEGYDRAWVEEAQTLSALSLRLLRPTLRKPGSQIWFSWNPRNPDDPVDEFLRCNSEESRKRDWTPPPDAIVERANYMDNPWFFKETNLPDEMRFDKRRDKDTFEHVWLGEYERNSEARVFRDWTVDDFDPPTARETLLAGADWGFASDPTVLVVCFIRGRTLHIWKEMWGLGVDVDRIPWFFDQVDPEWTKQKAVDPSWKSLARKVPIRADSARPDTISYVKRNGFSNLVPATKGPGSIEDGITFLKSYDIVVHGTNCPHTVKELTRYSYKIDPKTDKVTAELADKDNHLIDALRYALENVRHARTSSREDLPF